MSTDECIPPAGSIMTAGHSVIVASHDPRLADLPLCGD
jgi:hypothetical protein